MGQDWRVLNLDAQKTYGGWGKLGEFLFDSTPEVLVSDLRIPNKISFEKIVKAARSTGASGWDTPQASEPWVPEGKCHLTYQPVEVIRTLFGFIDNPQDAISLSLTCYHLLECGLERIDQLLIAPIVHWAGHRLICIGDYSTNEDMPPGVLSPEE
ncbi:hypothetical protein FRB95_006054 [Tulasnella sp. JGI-2019a]|nr:hypothetical protein FRB95_006054 [Tulasnella sp. JGI-2019a]